MSATISADEVREAARVLLATHASPSRVRALFDQPSRTDQELWTQMGSLGWPSMMVSEAHGGLGGRFADVTVLLEELGRHAAGGPFLATSLATAAVLRAGTPAQCDKILPALAAGVRMATISLAPVRATPSASGGFLLEGTARFVLDAANAELLVVAARTAEGRDVFTLVGRDRSGVVVETVPVLDLTRQLGHLSFSGVMVEPEDVMAEAGDASAAIAAVADHAAVAIAADAIGIAREVTERTSAYARERVQFGVPIGSFQGVKHQLADMFTTTEAAATLATAAAEALSTGASDSSALAAMAKYLACRTASDVAGRGVQLHGGIGYTWEHDMHIFLKRAKLDEALFGDRRSQLNVIANAIVNEEER